jgi:hypothetical protein
MRVPLKDSRGALIDGLTAERHHHAPVCENPPNDPAQSYTLKWGNFEGLRECREKC